MCSHWTGPGDLGPGATSRLCRQTPGPCPCNGDAGAEAWILPGSDTTSCDAPRAASRPSACAPARPGTRDVRVRARQPSRAAGRELGRGRGPWGAPRGSAPARALRGRGSREGCRVGQVPGPPRAARRRGGAGGLGTGRARRRGRREYTVGSEKEPVHAVRLGRVPEIGSGKDPRLVRDLSFPPSPAPQEAWTVRLGLDLTGHFLLHNEGEITPFRPGAQLPSSWPCGWDHTPGGVSRSSHRSFTLPVPFLKSPGGLQWICTQGFKDYVFLVLGGYQLSRDPW